LQGVVTPIIEGAMKFTLSQLHLY